MNNNEVDSINSLNRRRYRPRDSRPASSNSTPELHSTEVATPNPHQTEPSIDIDNDHVVRDSSTEYVVDSPTSPPQLARQASMPSAEHPRPQSRPLPSLAQQRIIIRPGPSGSAYLNTIRIVPRSTIEHLLPPVIPPSFIYRRRAPRRPAAPEPELQSGPWLPQFDELRPSTWRFITFQIPPNSYSTSNVSNETLEEHNHSLSDSLETEDYDDSDDEGLTIKQIDTLETEKFDSSYSKGHISCSVCLSNYKNEESLRVLPCNHLFHQICVDFWLKSHRSCPLCRYDVSLIFN